MSDYVLTDLLNDGARRVLAQESYSKVQYKSDIQARFVDESDRRLVFRKQVQLGMLDRNVIAVHQPGVFDKRRWSAFENLDQML